MTRPYLQQVSLYISDMPLESFFFFFIEYRAFFMEIIFIIFLAVVTGTVPLYRVRSTSLRQIDVLDQLPHAEADVCIVYSMYVFYVCILCMYSMHCLFYVCIVYLMYVLSILCMYSILCIVYSMYVLSILHQLVYSTIHTSASVCIVYSIYVLSILFDVK